MVRLRPLFKPQQLRTAITTTTPPLYSQQTTAAAAAAAAAALFRPSSYPSIITPNIRAASTKSSPAPALPEIPPPTPFIPDVQTFLTVIGRGLGQHASKFPTWEALFSLSSEQLQELGIEPPRTRRYLLQWRQRFRRGQFGIGGDLQHVRDGAAELRVLETEKPGGGAVRKNQFVVNVPPGQSPRNLSPDQMSRVQGYKVQGARTIVGPYALPLKHEAGARIAVTEGMWEDRRGRKIDGGERRRTKVRYKKRIAERRELREQGLL